MRKGSAGQENNKNSGNSGGGDFLIKEHKGKIESVGEAEEGY